MPRSHKDVQQFLGLVQYLVHFMPDITMYTGPLSAICRNGQPFYWKPLHEVCFNHIKAIACKLPVLKPIDPTSDDPIWVICDASMSSISTMYSQGATWQTCRLAGFMSKKFTAAQMNYRVFEMETIAILEGLLKWEDKLLGCKVLVVTDHKALEFFKMQQCLNSRQAHWMEFLVCFNFDITYVKGEMNLVADALSRYYENNQWDESYNASHYVNTDARLDPKGEDLPWDRFEESRAMQDADTVLHAGSCPQRQWQALRRADKPISFVPKCPVIEGIKARQHKAAELAINKESNQSLPVLLRAPPENSPDPTIEESSGQLLDLCPQLEGDCSVIDDIRSGYVDDLLFAKVLTNTKHHKNFEASDSLLYTRNRAGDSVLCILLVVLNKRQLTEIVIAQAHEVLGHFGLQKTADYIRCHLSPPGGSNARFDRSSSDKLSQCNLECDRDESEVHNLAVCRKVPQR
jgi:RNase H-like domain found in reverse transcriptase